MTTLKISVRIIKINCLEENEWSDALLVAPFFVLYCDFCVVKVFAMSYIIGGMKNAYKNTE